MIRVTCAIIRNEDNKVLIVRRGEKSEHPFKWEFPGGKVNDGETDEECITREIDEELSIDIVICGSLNPVVYDYGHKVIKLIPFICDTINELPVLSEHIEYEWLNPTDLLRIDFCEADIIVAKEYYQSMKLNLEPDPEPDNTSQQGIDDDEIRSLITSTVSTKEAGWVATSAAGDQVLLRKLFDYSFSDDKKLAFHSSWILSKVCDLQPEVLYPYLNEMITRLVEINNGSARRSFLRILSLTDPDKIAVTHHGILADYCFIALNSGFSAIAVKAYSMEILYRFARKYPELATELTASINMLRGEGSAGIKARGTIILKKLAGFNGDKESV